MGGEGDGRRYRRLDSTKDFVALQPYRRVNRELSRYGDNAASRVKFVLE